MGQVTDSLLLLRKLAETFGRRLSRDAEHTALSWARRLGATAVPLCLRELGHENEDRAGWAFALLVELARRGNHGRVIDALHQLSARPDGCDRAKLRAVALLAELGEAQACAALTDPEAARTESMKRMAARLVTDADVAQAGCTVVDQFASRELPAFVTELAECDPRAGSLLCAELVRRDDVDCAVRLELMAWLRSADSPSFRARRSRARRRALILEHPDGHSLVVGWARRPRSCPPRFRSITALLDPGGQLVELGYGDDATAAEIDSSLIAEFTACGFAITTRSTDDARSLVLDALGQVSRDAFLPKEIYLGRDLFGLAPSDHLAVRPLPEPEPEHLLARGFEAYRRGDTENAERLFEHVLETGDRSRAHAGLGLCAARRGQLEIAEWRLERAAGLEPDWAEHHWNLAAVVHRSGCRGSCYLALRRFVERAGDSDHRGAAARAFIAEYERQARLLHPGADAGDVAAADREIRLGLGAECTGQRRAAEEHFRRATAAVPTHFRAWTELARLRAESGARREAEELATRALREHPGYLPAVQLASRSAAPHLDSSSRPSS